MTFSLFVFLLLSSCSCAFILIVQTQHTHTVGRALRSQRPVTVKNGNIILARHLLSTVCPQKHSSQSCSCQVNVAVGLKVKITQQVWVAPFIEPFIRIKLKGLWLTQEVCVCVGVCVWTNERVVNFYCTAFRFIVNKKILSDTDMVDTERPL